MATINVSIPEKLKQKAEKLVEEGYYSSFSDMVRDSLRNILDKNIYDIMGDKAEQEYIEGKTTTLKTEADIENFINSLEDNVRTSSNQSVRKTTRKIAKK